MVIFNEKETVLYTGKYGQPKGNKVNFKTPYNLYTLFSVAHTLSILIINFHTFCPESHWCADLTIS
jgi:hypothetical protein